MDWLLRMRDVGDGAFEITPHSEALAGYGGFLMAGAARAASATAEGMHLHALQATFLARPGPGPICFEVEATRTGRSSAVRRVVASPASPAVIVTASFHAAGASAPAAADAETVPPGPDGLARFDTGFGGIDLLDLRPVDGVPRSASNSRVHPYWARPARPFGDGPAATAAALALASDYLVTSTATPPDEGAPGMAVTLNHSLWLHATTAADDWLRYDAEPLVYAGNRTLTRGTIHDRAGRLVASFAQEMLRLGRT